MHQHIGISKKTALWFTCCFCYFYVVLGCYSSKIVAVLISTGASPIVILQVEMETNFFRFRGIPRPLDKPGNPHPLPRTKFDEERF
jgi:transposase InsO family protein